MLSNGISDKKLKSHDGERGSRSVQIPGKGCSCLIISSGD